MAARARRVFTSVPFLGIVVAVCSWPTFPLTPAPGLDPSWGAGLYMATHQGLVFGREVIFTYGPLGFLSLPTLWYQDLGAAAVAYSSLVHITACMLVLWAGVRIFDRLLATIVAIVACSFLGPPLVVIALILAAALAGGWAGRRLEPALPLVLGALAAFALLVKVNYGVEILAIGAVGLVAVEWRKALLRLGEFAAAFVIALLLLWLLAGQPLGALPDYASTAGQTISGYSQAMVLSDPSSPFYVVLAVGVGAAATAAAWLLNSELEQRRRIVFTTLIALFSFLSFKEGFVREDGGHVALFVSAMVSVWFVLGWRRPLGWLGIASLAGVLAVALNFQPSSVQPIDHAKAARELVRTMLDPARRHYDTDLGRAGILTSQAVDPAISEAIGNSPTQVGPFETSVAWALGLNWHPLPVYQDYSAYTPDLDHDNAEALRAADGPALILRHPSYGLIDGRFPAYDPPAASVAMICNFAPELIRGNWMLLYRTANRCGPERLVGRTSTSFGQPIRVPATPRNSLVIARLHGVGLSASERVRALLFRAKPRYVSFAGGDSVASTQANFRLVPATAEDGLLISAPSAADYPAAFALAPNPEAFTISPGSGTIEADFYSIPIRSAGAALQQGSAQRADTHRGG